MIKPPVFVDGGKRIVVAAHGGVNPKGCYTYVSDDQGETWKRSNTVTSPDHAGGGFHKGIRWNHGAVEPTVVELNDGTLWMLMRTSQDRHYQSFSTDGGLTWSESTPSPFYGTITMPTLSRLSDGRLLLLWCNTTPLPEMETANGVWDDVFTNRDVTHAAISADDGKTWTGFREIGMDSHRNESDYALAGKGIDRGMHQAQVVEPVPGRIVAALGQHPLHRKIVMMDVDWLNEPMRESTFADSLQSWSTFCYIKGIKGHCSYNRINGVELIEHPERPGAQVMKLVYAPADSLVSDVRGGVWNFPAMRAGRFTTRLKLEPGAERLVLALNDRWFNPSDSVGRYEAMYDLELDPSTLGIRDNDWHTVTVDWNLDARDTSATVTVDGRKRRKKLPLNNPSQHGLSYAHFMALPTPRPAAALIESVKAEKTVQ